MKFNLCLAVSVSAIQTFALVSHSVILYATKTHYFMREY
jgi:hypothetical protein